MQNSEKIWRLVDARKDAYEALSDRVWGMPEIAYTEYRSVAEHRAMLEQEGFRITERLADIPTAVMGEAGEGGPVIAILGEYDALYIRGHPLAWPIAKLAHRRGIPVVHECNGPYEDLFIAWPQTRPFRVIFEYLQRSQYRDADVVISVAEGLTRWLVEDTGNRNVITNGNGANIDAFSPDAPRREGLPARFAVFFGQFPAWQGIATLLEGVR